jgi:hypothetical protein
MALIVEDGSIVAGAEAYITVSNADTYFSNRGNATWSALTTAAKEQALRKATDYMGQRYIDRWKGLIVSESQVLDWPRSGVVVRGYQVDDDTVPDAIQYACAMLAVRASAATLLADESRTIRARSIGPISVEYDPASPQAKKYPEVEKLLAPYLSGFSGVNVRLERA